jgi:hypothetical protein
MATNNTLNLIKETINAESTITAQTLYQKTFEAIHIHGIDPNTTWLDNNPNLCPSCEYWVAVPSLNGAYEVSNLGRLRNTKTKIIYRTQLRNGYVYINRCRGLYIHRLVGECFLNNDDPANKIQIDHLNGIKSNNTILNLEWVTRQENIRRAFENGQNIPHNRKRIAQLDKDNNVIAIYESITEASKITGININSISFAVNNRRKLAGGYSFQALASA